MNGILSAHLNFLAVALLCCAASTASLVDKASSVDFYPLVPAPTGNEDNPNRNKPKENSNTAPTFEPTFLTLAPTFEPTFFTFAPTKTLTTGEECGSGVCHHSSTCLELSLDEEPFVEHMCDCTNAYTEDTYYAGEFCQYASTQFCSDSNDPNGRQFCVNGGKCPTESHLPCECPEGFSGPRCAFQIGVDGEDYNQCELPCQNGGTCQKGIDQKKQNEFMRSFAHGDFSHLLSPSPGFMNFEHCVCPTGYFGIHCEYQMEQCGNGEHLCFHGSTCLRNGQEFSCDCLTSASKTAGLFCEHIASSECQEWVDMKNGHRGFCTNGGHCQVDEYGSSSCTCPSGYTGEHCEFRVDLSSDRFERRVGLNAAFTVILIAVAVGLPVVILVAFRFRSSSVEPMDNTRTPGCDGIMLDENMEPAGQGGFSAVEIL